MAIGLEQHRFKDLPSHTAPTATWMRDLGQTIQHAWYNDTAPNGLKSKTKTKQPSSKTTLEVGIACFKVSESDGYLTVTMHSLAVKPTEDLAH